MRTRLLFGSRQTCWRTHRMWRDATQRAWSAAKAHTGAAQTHDVCACVYMLPSPAVPLLPTNGQHEARASGARRESACGIAELQTHITHMCVQSVCGRKVRQICVHTSVLCVCVRCGDMRAAEHNGNILGLELRRCRHCLCWHARLEGFFASMGSVCFAYRQSRMKGSRVMKASLERYLEIR